MVLDGFGWFWVVLGGFGWFWVVLCGFGWFWVVLDGFGWFWVVLGGFGWFWVVEESRTSKFARRRGRVAVLGQELHGAEAGWLFLVKMCTAPRRQPILCMECCFLHGSVAGGSGGRAGRPASPRTDSPTTRITTHTPNPTQQALRSLIDN